MCEQCESVGSPGEVIAHVITSSKAHRHVLVNGMLPSAPRSAISVLRHSRFLEHVGEIEKRLNAQKIIRDAAHTKSHQARNQALLSLHCRHAGDAAGASKALNSALEELSGVLPYRTIGSDDDHALSATAQQVAVVQIFDTFLATGALGGRPVPSFTRKVGEKAPREADEVATAESSSYSDEEWLGALMSSAHEIGRYASNAAAAGDSASVKVARSVVVALQDRLLTFDFRNGPLRRSFDSVKYVVRRLEDTLYELSLFPPKDAATTSGSDGDPAPDAATLVDAAALEEARATYAALDAAREALIKRCREPQKLSKQAIYALHRGDLSGAAKQLDGARKLADAILREDLGAYPSLRSQGTVRAMLEEFGEAVLFEAWLTGGAGQHEILPSDAAALLDGRLDASEYFGAVCDLVGEVGRYAVRKATERDAAEVGEALATAAAVQSAVLAMGTSAPRGLHKKLDGLRTSARKMETLLYELSLVERSGRTREAPPDIPSDPALVKREFV